MKTKNAPQLLQLSNKMLLNTKPSSGNTQDPVLNTDQNLDSWIFFDPETIGSENYRSNVWLYDDEINARTLHAQSRCMKQKYNFLLV